MCTHFLARDLRRHCLFTSSHNICVCEESHPQTRLGLQKIDLRITAGSKEEEIKKKRETTSTFSLPLWDAITFGLISSDLLRETQLAATRGLCSVA